MYMIAKTKKMEWRNSNVFLQIIIKNIENGWDNLHKLRVILTDVANI